MPRKRKSMTDAEVRELLLGKLLKWREYVLTDNTDPLSMTDEMGQTFEQIEGHWPTEEDMENYK